MKDENKREKVVKFFSELLSEVKENFMLSTFNKISQINLDENDEKNNKSFIIV